VTQGEDIPLARPEVGEAELDALGRVLASRRLSVGAELLAFEQACATVAGSRGAVGVNSGSAGLTIALEALGIGPGDEVACPGYTFVGSLNAIRRSGAVPRLIDIDRHSLNLDPAALEAAIGPRLRAVMVVHLFGRPAPMDAIAAVAARHDLRIVEDACEAIGSRYRGRPVGALGDAGVFGFYPNKPVAAGEGGMIVAHEAALLQRCRQLRNQGYDPLSDSWHPRLPGHSARLSELHAAVGRVQLDRLEAALAAREQVAELYRARMVGHARIELPAPAECGDRIAWFTWPVRIRGIDAAARDRLLEALRARGIGCGPYFRPPHWLDAHRACPGAARLPVTEDIGRRSLGLPLYAAMGAAEVERVVATLESCIG
jgi:perosamine synthetase